jgi:hypothetical protein
VKINKKLAILAIFLVAVLAVGAVSAAEDIADDSVASVDADAVSVSEDTEAVVEEVPTDEVIAEDPVTYTADDIRTIISGTTENGTAALVENGVYQVGAEKISIGCNMTIDGKNATIYVDGAAQGGSGATFMPQADGISFKNINFINTNGPKEYGDEIKGVAIQLTKKNMIVDNCQFLDFSSGIYGKGGSYCTISNCYFNGSTTSATGTGDNEAGTKAINIMGCNHMTITGCIFEGQVLDGISIASNSGFNTITYNTFINNVYAIYFGGASTQGCIIANNKFDNCGYSEDKDGNILSDSFSLLSTKKSASGYQLVDNEFIMNKGHVIIEAESGDTHHGYPSPIGDINITGNTVTVVEGVNPSDITFVRIVSNSGPLNPYAPINITNNIIDAGIIPVRVWLKDWDNEAGVVIPAADKASTVISVEKVATADGEIIIKLADTNGDALGSKTITYTVAGGEEQTVTTGPDGTATISGLTDGEIVLNYAGDDQTKESTATVVFQSTATPKLASVIDADDLTGPAVDVDADGRIGKYFVVTLKDAEGTLLTDKFIQIGFNGKVYNRTTDENGQAKLQINLANQGIYTFAVSFLGDEQYNGSFKVCKITINKQTPTLTVPNKSYSASAKTKSITATFKSESGNVVANKKVTFTVNGKTYTATTDSKGVATVNVSLNKKGTYSFTAKFAGDNTYAAVSKTAKLTIK